MIPQKIIDNSNIKLAAFLNDVLKEIPHTQFDIATAFFNIQAFAFIKDNIHGVKLFRLLLGKTPEIRNETTLGEMLLKMVREEVEGFDFSHENPAVLIALNAMGLGAVLAVIGGVFFVTYAAASILRGEQHKQS